MSDDITMTAERARRLERTLLILMRYTAGEAVQSICDEFECTKSTVLRIARKASAPKRSRRKYAEMEPGILADHSAGMPLKAIAEKWGVSQAYVSQVGTKAGVGRYDERRNHRGATRASKR